MEKVIRSPQFFVVKEARAEKVDTDRVVAIEESILAIVLKPAKESTRLITPSKNQDLSFRI